MSDLHGFVEDGSSAVLVSLDVSAGSTQYLTGSPFERLEKDYGVSGVVLDCLRSFLTGRTQAVVVGGISSSVSDCLTGVPQGSVLGPTLLLYISPLARII